MSPRGSSVAKMPRHLGAQVVRRHRAGVDQDVGALAQRCQQRRLPADADQRRLVGAQGMPSPGLAETADQRARVAVEIDQHRIAPRGDADIGEMAQKPADIEFPVARIDPHHHRMLDRRTGEEPREQRQRQVVDGLEALILQGADRGRPAGARGPGNDHDVMPRSGASRSGHGMPAVDDPARRSLNPGLTGSYREEWSRLRLDLARRARKSIQHDLPRYVIVSDCGIRAVGGLSRSTASTTSAAPTLPTRRRPTPRASIMPAMVSGASRHQPPVPQTDRHPVVGNQPRAQCDHPQAKPGLARAGGAEDQHRAPAARDRRRVKNPGGITVGGGVAGHACRPPVRFSLSRL